MSRPLHGYVATQFLVVFAATVALALGLGWTWPIVAAGALWLAISLLAFDFLLEGRRMAIRLEALRLAVTAVSAAIVLWKMPMGHLGILAPGALWVGSTAWLQWIATQRWEPADLTTGQAPT
jgi:hypothetical protein